MNLIQKVSQLFVVSLAISAAACSNGPSENSQKEAEAEVNRLNAIQAAYMECIEKTDMPPAGKEELAKFLPAGVEADHVFTSARDGHPYVIHWGVDFRKHQSQQPFVLGYEKTAKDGKRFVWTGFGVLEMSDEEFSNAEFPPGEKNGL
ncbi:MAG: hypothetical protein O3A00_25115 [Planctomycetota bacterium]|nr:hypothetical protein [Planctomycetota bacterium]